LENIDDPKSILDTQAKILQGAALPQSIEQKPVCSHKTGNFLDSKGEPLNGCCTPPRGPFKVPRTTKINPWTVFETRTGMNFWGISLLDLMHSLR
jgi:hypothetical protein